MGDARTGPFGARTALPPSRRCCQGPRLADPPVPHQGDPDMDSLQPSSIDPAKLNALLQRAVEDLSAGYGGVMMSLGHRLGLYKAMAGSGPLRPRELSGRTVCAARYVTEWLTAQAAGGYAAYHRTSCSYEL